MLKLFRYKLEIKRFLKESSYLENMLNKLKTLNNACLLSYIATLMQNALSIYHELLNGSTFILTTVSIYFYGTIEVMEDHKELHPQEIC